MASNLHRMIVVPPTLFERWKELVTEDRQLTQLDRNMKKIMKMKHIPEDRKWYFYRHQLMLNAMRNRTKNNSLNMGEKNVNDINDKSLKYDSPKLKSSPISYRRNPISQKRYGRKSTFGDIRSLIGDNSAQQDYLLPWTDDFQDNYDVDVDGNAGVSNNRLSSNERQQQPPKFDEDIFSSTMNKSADTQSDSEIMYVNSDAENEDEQNLMDYSSFIKDVVLKDAPKNVRIVREGQSQDPSEYRIFELSDGSQVNVPVNDLLKPTAPLKGRRSSLRGVRVTRSQSNPKVLEERKKKELSFTRHKKHAAQKRKVLQMRKANDQKGGRILKWITLR